MSGVLRFLAAFSAGGISAYILGTALNTQFVLAGHNVPVSFGDRLNMTMFDISNMLLYLAMILVGFLIAFGIAALLKRQLPKLSAAAYPIAGAAALGVILGAMYLTFQTVPISGARSTFGFLSQMLAGGVGGWVFARILDRKVAS